MVAGAQRATEHHNNHHISRAKRSEYAGALGSSQPSFLNPTARLQRAPTRGDHRRPPLGAGCRRFESGHPDNTEERGTMWEGGGGERGRVGDLGAEIAVSPHRHHMADRMFVRF